jgi:hypothetical protein
LISRWQRDYQFAVRMFDLKLEIVDDLVAGH